MTGIVLVPLWDIKLGFTKSGKLFFSSSIVKSLRIRIYQLEVMTQFDFVLPCNDKPKHFSINWYSLEAKILMHIIDMSASEHQTELPELIFY